MIVFSKYRSPFRVNTRFRDILVPFSLCSPFCGDWKRLRFPKLRFWTWNPYFIQHFLPDILPNATTKPDYNCWEDQSMRNNGLVQQVQQFVSKILLEIEVHKKILWEDTGPCPMTLLMYAQGWFAKAIVNITQWILLDTNVAGYHRIHRTAKWIHFMGIWWRPCTLLVWTHSKAVLMKVETKWTMNASTFFSVFCRQLPAECINSGEMERLNLHVISVRLNTKLYRFINKLLELSNGVDTLFVWQSFSSYALNICKCMLAAIHAQARNMFTSITSMSVVM